MSCHGAGVRTGLPASTVEVPAGRRSTRGQVALPGGRFAMGDHFGEGYDIRVGRFVHFALAAGLEAYGRRRWRLMANTSLYPLAASHEQSRFDLHLWY